MAQMFQCDYCGAPTANFENNGTAYTIYGPGERTEPTPLISHCCDACRNRIRRERKFQDEGAIIDSAKMTCPWCGYEYDKSESDQYFDFVSDEEVVCPSCGRKFDVIADYPTFDTYRSLCEMPEDYGKEGQE